MWVIKNVIFLSTKFDLRFLLSSSRLVYRQLCGVIVVD